MPGNIKYAFSSVSADSDIIRVPCDCARVPKSSCLAATRHRLMLTLVRRSRGTLPQYYVRVRAKNNGLPKARKGKDLRAAFITFHRQERRIVIPVLARTTTG